MALVFLTNDPLPWVFVINPLYAKLDKACLTVTLEQSYALANSASVGRGAFGV